MESLCRFPFGAPFIVGYVLRKQLLMTVDLMVYLGLVTRLTWAVTSSPMQLALTSVRLFSLFGINPPVQITRIPELVTRNVALRELTAGSDGALIKSGVFAVG